MKILNKFLGLTQLRNKDSNGQSSGKEELVQIWWIWSFGVLDQQEKINFSDHFFAICRNRINSKYCAHSEDIREVCEKL